MTDHRRPERPSSHAHDLRAVARRAMVERHLLPEFSAVAIAETDAIRAAAAPLPPPARDMRDRLWASIDNDDSRDLDQLSVAEALANDEVRVFVAIADVDALVARGSAIDDHARANTTSVYTAAQVFPMLPEKLSTNLTSLGAGVDRRAVVAEWVVRADGDIGDFDIYPATVRNRAKLAYNGVAAWLDGAAPPPPALAAAPGIDEQLRLQDGAARRLRRKRCEHGALNLETLEARPVFRGDALSDLVPDGRNRAKDLIEDLMIAANVATARFLDGKGFPTLRRVLRSPERWAKIVALAAAHAERLPADPSNTALEAFLDKARAQAPARFADLSLTVVKLLGRGEYALERPGRAVSGHFGLALHDYTHSTAPNRRFPDLVTQRLLKAALAGHRPPYDDGALGDLARHCTEQEDAAAKVERQVRKSAAALLLAPRVGERFDSIVTGASPKGTYVRIAHPAAEGRLVRGETGLEVGDQVPVVLVHTDFERGFIDFARS